MADDTIPEEPEQKGDPEKLSEQEVQDLLTLVRKRYQAG